MQGTGGGSPKLPPLNDTEERLMSLLGWKAITGDNNMELGIVSAILILLLYGQLN